MTFIRYLVKISEFEGWKTWVVHSVRLLTDSLLISKRLSLLMEGHDIKYPHRILQVINNSNYFFCFYFYKMGVQILPINCAMDLTGLLFVPCASNHRHYPWERRYHAETCSKLMYMGDLWFYINWVHLLINVGDCVVEFISYGALAHISAWENGQLWRAEKEIELPDWCV